VLHYRNLQWQHREVLLEDSMAEMAQHSVDHLDGILATMRAIDNKSFFME
jgi:peptide deformylase